MVIASLVIARLVRQISCRVLYDPDYKKIYCFILSSCFLLHLFCLLIIFFSVQYSGAEHITGPREKDG